MKSLIKGGIIFLLGVGAGGFAGYMFGQKKMTDKCTKEIDQMRQYYSDKAKSESTKLAKDIMSKEIIFEKEPEGDFLEIKPEPVKNVEEAKLADNAYEKNNEVDYTKFSASETKTPSALVKEQEETRYAIDVDTFEEDTTFAKETLVYYAEDGVLTDTEDNVVSIEGLVGRSFLNHFGEYYPDIAYIRNTDEETDYEIMWKDGSYAEDVLGTMVGGR